jgi:hypothetical protein
MARKADPKKRRADLQTSPVTVDDLTAQVNGLTLSWIAFHKQLHNSPPPPTIPWLQASLDNRTSLDWTARVSDAHATNCKHCRTAVADYHKYTSPYRPDPSPASYDEQGYLNAILSWLTLDDRMFAALWGLYFPKVQIPKITVDVGDPSTLHEAFDWLALNGNGFMQTENQGKYYQGRIHMERIPDPPTRPSNANPLQSLQTIEVACNRLARFHGDILDTLKASLFARTERRNERGLGWGAFGIK